MHRLPGHPLPVRTGQLWRERRDSSAEEPRGRIGEGGQGGAARQEGHEEETARQGKQAEEVGQQEDEEKGKQKEAKVGQEHKVEEEEQRGEKEGGQGGQEVRQEVWQTFEEKVGEEEQEL